MAITIRQRVKLLRVFSKRRFAWLVLLGSVIAFNVFAHQVMLVPQSRDYHPNWYGARWIQPVITSGETVGYYRKIFSVGSQPTSAFLTIQGAQSYTLYVNGWFIQQTAREYISGATNLAHIYDMTPFLNSGTNVVALCVTNQDDGIPAVRAVMGASIGQQSLIIPTDQSWRAAVSTDDHNQITQPCNLSGSGAPNSTKWSNPNYSDATWPSAQLMSGRLPRDGILSVNPIVFERPFETTWITANGTTDAFFTHSFDVSASKEAWLRVASTGEAEVYLDGHHLSSTPAQLIAPMPNVVSLTTSLYDVSPYVESGHHQLAIHVVAVDENVKNGAAHPRAAALALDMLSIAPDGTIRQISADTGWRAAGRAANGWLTSDPPSWANATEVEGIVLSTVTPYKLVVATEQEIDTFRTLAIAGITTLMVLLVWFGGLFIQMRRRWSVIGGVIALDRVALSFIPGLALMLLLGTLSVEPLMPRPFPFTMQWLIAIIVVIALTFGIFQVSSYVPVRRFFFQAGREIAMPQAPRRYIMWGIVIAMTALAAFMATYQLPYESYWQDEVTSVYAAHGILATGLPRLLSGFIYEKAELYSYILAGMMALFGDGPVATRIISVIEYVISIPLVFLIGRYFLGRRVGLLATAIVVFSPLALRWGREARMYQQAELFTLIVMYLFYRAIEPGAKTRYVYLSLIATVLMYLSHEETFIVLPTLVIAFAVKKRFTWVRDRHWWLAGLSAISIILFQYYLSKVTHPPILGTDHSQEPFIAFSPENLPFYVKLLFDTRSLSNGSLPNMQVTSILALIACMSAWFSRDRALRYLSFFVGASLLILIFLFSLTSDRYVYPLFPAMAMLAASTAVRAIDAIDRLARARLMSFARGSITVACAIGVIVTILLAQTTAISNFGLAVSRTLDISYRHHYPEYQKAGAYIQDHWQDGDLLITLAPAIDGAFYATRPTYQLYRSFALYLFEQDGHIVDTPTGSTLLLNGRDLDSVLAEHHRVWLFSSAAYQRYGKSTEYDIADNFALEYEVQELLIYLHTG